MSGLFLSVRIVPECLDCSWVHSSFWWFVHGCSWVHSSFWWFVLDDSSVLPDNIEILPDNIEILPDNIEILPDNIEILPDNIEILLMKYLQNILRIY